MEKRLMSKEAEDSLTEIIINFIIENELTIANMLVVVEKVTIYMNENAVISGKECK